LYGVVAATLPVVTRWIHVQTVDIWLAIFFTVALGLLIKPQNTLSFYLKLGLAIGLVIGTKYSGLLFSVILLLVFNRQVRRYITPLRGLGMLLMTSASGFFWYFRNWWAIGNPLYPLDLGPLKGVATNPIIHTQIWKALVLFPVSMANAFMSEYGVWVIGLVGLMVLFLSNREYLRHVWNDAFLRKLMLLVGLNVLVFLILPSGSSYQLHVSQFRFSLPVFLPLILSGFLLAQRFGHSKIISVLTLIQLLFIPSYAYQPKIMWLMVPVVWAIFYPKEFQKMLSQR
jgi:hypothetical protein